MLQQARAQYLDLAAQLNVPESVRARLGAHDDIDRRVQARTACQVQNSEATQLSQSPLESVAFDRGMAVLRNHKADSGHGAGRKNDPEIEVGRAETLAVPHGGAQVATAGQPLLPP